MKDKGREELLEALRDTLLLAEHNPCRASDSTLMALANSLRALIDSELSMDISREHTARFLGMSTRSLGRKVAEGKIPSPHRSGHKALSFSALSIARLLHRKR